VCCPSRGWAGVCSGCPSASQDSSPGMAASGRDRGLRAGQLVQSPEGALAQSSSSPGSFLSPKWAWPPPTRALHPPAHIFRKLKRLTSESPLPYKAGKPSGCQAISWGLRDGLCPSPTLYPVIQCMGPQCMGPGPGSRAAFSGQVPYLHSSWKGRAQL
jgi:hypothetical protein